MQAYVLHRLVTAGYQGGNLFQPDAMRSLYRSSRGIPRLINILSHKAMMVAYGRGDKTVGKEHMQLAVKDTEDAQLSGRQGRHWKTALRWLALAAAGGAILWLVFNGIRS